MRGKQLATVLKLACSVFILTWLLKSIDLQGLYQAFSRASLWVFMGVLLLNLAGVILSVYKWQKLLKHDGLPCGYFFLLHLYFCGIFFNTFLPTSIGGDAVRGLMLTRKSRRPMVAVTSIFAERFSGLLAMLPLLACGYVLAGEFLEINFNQGIEVMMVGTFVVIVSLIIFVLSRRFAPGAERGMNKINAAVTGVRGYMVDCRLVWTLVWTSVVFQLLVVGVYWTAGIAFNLHINFAVFLLVVPLVTLLALLPISLNGLGLREGGVVYLLGRAGVDGHEALALSLAVYGLSLVLAMFGGLSWVLGRPEEGLPDPE